MVTVIAFSLLPYAQLAATNLGEELASGRVLLYGALTTALTLAVILVVARRRPPLTGTVAVGVSVFLLMFFNYPAITRLLEQVGIPETWHVAGWAIAALVGGGLAVLLGRMRWMQIYAAIFGVALVLGPLFQVATHRSSPAPTQGTASATLEVDAKSRPNIYFFLVDGYVRPDVLKDYVGVDVASFTDWLEDRDFQVSERALANYSTTFLSLASTLEMTYLADENDQIKGGRLFYEHIRGDNATVETMRRLGYRYIHAYPGVFKNSRCSGVEDVCIGNAEVLLDETELALLKSTPLWPFVPTATRNELLARNVDPRYVVREALQATQGDAAPHFLFAHLLNPHPPYLRDAECNLRDVEWTLQDWGKGRTVGEYGNAIQCLNTQLRSTVATILAKDPESVIIIQADHGYGSSQKWRDVSLQDEPAVKRLSILSAIRLPPDCENSVPEDVTPVNTFRFVIGCIEDATPQLLPNRHYGVGYGKPEVYRLTP